MATQKVPLEALQKIRRYLTSALTFPDSENHPKKWSAGGEELPEPDSLDGLGDLFHFGGIPEETIHSPNTQGQWFISAVNPGSVLAKLPGLRLKPEMRLVSYLYRLEQGRELDGINATWALPESLSTTAHLQEALRMCGGRDKPPEPKGVLADFMEAVEGDRSPMSYVIASILRRELLESGALGKTRQWSDHHLIDSLPSAQWQWRTSGIKDLSPKVRLFPDGKAALEFFTCRNAGTHCLETARVALFQHLDQYSPNTYRAQSLDRAVAIAPKSL
ncbi:hypothetical protein ACKFKF_18635 [Phormidesmis sp. 146-12]